MNNYQVLFAVLLAVASQAEAGFSCFGIGEKDPYTLLDKYLVANVKDDDVESNIKAACDWQSKLDECQENPQLSQAVEQFCLLKRTIKPDLCDGDTANMLFNNARVFKKFPAGLEATNRVEKIILSCMQSHANHCEPSHLNDFLRLVDSKMIDVSSPVYRFLEQLALTRLEREHKPISFRLVNYFEWYKQPVSSHFYPIQTLMGAYWALFDATTGSQDRAYLRRVGVGGTGINTVDLDRIKGLVESTFKLTCNNIRTHFGKFLSKALFDFQVQDSLTKGDLVTNNPIKYKLYSVLATHYLCVTLGATQYEQLIRAIGKLAATV